MARPIAEDGHPASLTERVCVGAMERKVTDGAGEGFLEEVAFAPGP